MVDFMSAKVIKKFKITIFKFRSLFGEGGGDEVD